MRTLSDDSPSERCSHFFFLVNVIDLLTGRNGKGCPYRMKNQYIGDIGDYGKFTLLRALIADRYSVGVNWYLTPDDGRTDGKFTDYLKRDTDYLDTELFQMLKALLLSQDGNLRLENRNVTAIESNDILPSVTFFSDVLNYDRITGPPLQGVV